MAIVRRCGNDLVDVGRCDGADPRRARTEHRESRHGGSPGLGAALMTGSSTESDPQDQLEHMILELAAIGPVVFVFGPGWLTAHLGGSIAPTFAGRGADRRWRVEVGEEDKWVLSVKVSEITGVAFVRGPRPFPKFLGQESLVVDFVGTDGRSTLHCYLAGLYGNGRMDAEKLEAWSDLRSRFSADLERIKGPPSV